MSELSRQRKYQLRNKEHGLCSHCKNPIDNRSNRYCEFHYKRYEFKGSIAYDPITKKLIIKK